MPGLKGCRAGKHPDRTSKPIELSVPEFLVEFGQDYPVGFEGISIWSGFTVEEGDVSGGWPFL